LAIEPDAAGVLDLIEQDARPDLRHHGKRGYWVDAGVAAKE
jgi:hypothetical protein